MAGIPASVVRAARRQLREFEERAAINPAQPDLFAAPARTEEFEPVHPVLERLAAINPDDLTPKEALVALYELKALNK